MSPDSGFYDSAQDGPMSLAEIGRAVRRLERETRDSFASLKAETKDGIAGVRQEQSEARKRIHELGDKLQALPGLAEDATGHERRIEALEKSRAADDKRIDSLERDRALVRWGGGIIGAVLLGWLATNVLQIAKATDPTLTVREVEGR